LRPAKTLLVVLLLVGIFACSARCWLFSFLPLVTQLRRVFLRLDPEPRRGPLRATDEFP
jgi:hypothetical protein